MKKRLTAGLIAIVALAVLVWLGAVTWSRHQVQARMAEQVDAINGIAGLRAINTIEKDGFFSSEGKLRIMLENSVDHGGNSANVVLPWHVLYGVFHTRFSGHADLDMEQRRGTEQSGGKRLFADQLSPGEQIDFDARFSHLDEHLALDIALPQRVHYEDDTLQLTLDQATLHLLKDDQGLSLQGQWAGLDYQSAARMLLLNDMHWSIHYPADEVAGEETSKRIGRQDTLEVDSIRLQKRDALPVTLSGLKLSGSTQHQEKALSYLLKAHMDNAAVSEQQLGSATLSAVLERIDEQAARALLHALSDELEQYWQQPATTGGDEKQIAWKTDDIWSLIEPWQQHVFAILADSPRLRVDRLQLEIPMLDQAMHLDGEVTLDGTDITATQIERLRTSWGQAAFKRRLDGHFILHNTPPLLALIVGQSPDQDTLDLAIRDGVFLVNDDPWFLLN